MSENKRKILENVKSSEKFPEIADFFPLLGNKRNNCDSTFVSLSVRGKVISNNQ